MGTVERCKWRHHMGAVEPKRGWTASTMAKVPRSRNREETALQTDLIPTAAARSTCIPLTFNSDATQKAQLWPATQPLASATQPQTTQAATKTVTRSTDPGSKSIFPARTWRSKAL